MAEAQNTPQPGNYERFLEILGGDQLGNQDLLDQIRLFCDTFPGMSDPAWLVSVINLGMRTTDGRQVDGVSGLWERLKADYQTRNSIAIVPGSPTEIACARIFAVIQSYIANPAVRRQSESQTYQTTAEAAAQAETRELYAELEQMAAKVRELLQQQAADPRNEQIHQLEEQLRQAQESITALHEGNARKDRQIADLLARLRNQPGAGPAQPRGAPGPERRIPDYDYLTVFGLDKEWFYKVPGGRNKAPGKQPEKVLKTDEEIKQELKGLRGKIVLAFDARAIEAMKKVDPDFAASMDKLVKTANAAYDTLSKPDTRKIYLGMHGIILD